MLANNEIGVIQSLADIGAICKQRGVLLHCDATQAVGKVPVDVNKLSVDLMSFSAHKIYGPKGIGALYIRSRDPLVRLEPQIAGGGQQEGRRSGTLNVPGIVGFAAALRLCLEELPSEMKRLTTFRDQLAAAIWTELADVQLCGPPLDTQYENGTPLRLPGNLGLSFGNVDGEALLLAMGKLAVSSGAACTSVDSEPSHVLRALGMSDDAARSSLRFGLGRFNTRAEVQAAAEQVIAATRQLRGLAAPAGKP
jgi:cysteine desulfurase